jgi:hypothetical protein
MATRLQDNIMPTVLRDRLIAGIARGYSELDWSALGLLAAEEAGLDRDCAPRKYRPSLTGIWMVTRSSVPTVLVM